jgi:hypothetical protein
MKIPVVGLCPKIPQKKAGIRIDPPMSDPMPMGEPLAAIILAYRDKINYVSYIYIASCCSWY